MCGRQQQLQHKKRKLVLIEQGLMYDSDKKQSSPKFPWIKDPNLLHISVSVAIVRLNNTEERLLKLGPEYVKAYKEQMRDMVRCKLTSDELRNYIGPVTFMKC